MRTRGTTTQNDAYGVSLMETMIVIGVMAILLVIVAQIFALNYDVYAKQTARLDADTGAVFAARKISDFTRGASKVLATQNINGTWYTTSQDELVLRVPSIDANRDIIDATFDYIAIYRDATDTSKIFADTEIGTGSSRANGTKLITAHNGTMKFRYNAPDETDATRVSVFMINTKTVRGSTISSRAWTSLLLRNK